MNRCGVWLIVISVAGWQSALSGKPLSSGSERLTSTAASASLSVAQLKYLLIERFGPEGGSPGIFYCDSDKYPVGVGVSSELKRAQDTFPVIQKEAGTFNAITTHLGWDSADGLTTEKQLEVYLEYKKLNAIRLAPKGESYAFSLRNSDAARKGWITEGVISKQGEITIGERVTATLICPRCLAAGTRIDTPEGPIAVQALQPGMVIWTTTISGGRTPAAIVRITHMPIPPEYELIHLRLDDGRELTAAPVHPLGDGRLLAALVPGDSIGNAKILDLDRITPTSSATYDVLPDGETGEYWANGILLRSTLVEKSRR